MATQEQDTANAPAVPNANTVGRLFVEKYYNILVDSPQLLYRFYEDPSTPTPPSLNDRIISLSTLIQHQLASPDHDKFKVQIKTVDSQDSLNNGVVVMVTGSITLTRTFAQNFFLAPRENGYFVVNDIFNYVDGEPHQSYHNSSPTNRQTDALASTVSPMRNESTEEDQIRRSIYIGNLHPDIKPPQVEEEFKKFGAIKPSGVRVKTIRRRRPSYAFVEFEDAASAQAAIYASPMPMGARRVVIEAKRPNARRVRSRNGRP